MTTTNGSRAEIKWVAQNNRLVPDADAKISIVASSLAFAALMFGGFRVY